MGNQVQHKRRNPANCLACMGAENEGFDPNELQIDIDQPRGKITQSSTAYLSENERNFFKAAAGRNLSLIRFYLSNGININLLDEERTSPIHIACRYGSLQVVEELINSGVNLDITDMAGWTPLHLASFYQRSQVCSLLLNSGADAKIRNRDGNLAQDLVRDKMTAEVFKIQQEIFVFNDDRYMRVKDAVNKQLEEYYLNLKIKKQKQQEAASEKELAKQSQPCLSPSLQHQKLMRSNEKENTLRRQDSSYLSKSNISENEHEIIQQSKDNELTSNKIHKQMLSPTHSIPRFFDESINLNQLIMWQTNTREIIIYDGQCSFIKPTTIIEELANEFFNYNCYLGLSFLIVTQCIKPVTSSIIKWIQEDFQFINQRQVVRLLTNPILNEQQQLLQQYVDQCVVQQDLMPSIISYFKRLQVPDDPYVLDILVKEFSIKLFNLNQNISKSSKFPFKSEEALHMFCFALVIFDIECSKVDRQDAIRNFITNIQTINNGGNFSQNFIASIIDSMQSNQIVKLAEFSVEESLIGKLNNFATPIHLLKHKEVINNFIQTHIQNFRLYHVKEVCILISDNNIKIFQNQQANIQKVKNEIHITGKNSNPLIYIVSKDDQTFTFKQKNKKYRMANPKDNI